MTARSFLKSTLTLAAFSLALTACDSAAPDGLAATSAGSANAGSSLYIDGPDELERGCATTYYLRDSAFNDIVGTSDWKAYGRGVGTLQETSGQANVGASSGAANPARVEAISTGGSVVDKVITIVPKEGNCDTHVAF